VIPLRSGLTTRRYDRKPLVARYNWKRRTPHLVSGVLADLRFHLAVTIAELEEDTEPVALL
jgi:hypothetical protein